MTDCNVFCGCVGADADPEFPVVAVVRDINNRQWVFRATPDAIDAEHFLKGRCVGTLRHRTAEDTEFDVILFSGTPGGSLDMKEGVDFWEIPMSPADLQSVGRLNECRHRGRLRLVEVIEEKEQTP